MPTIDQVLSDVQRIVKNCSEWTVGYGPGEHTGAKEVFSWDMGSHLAASAVMDYLVRFGVTPDKNAPPSTHIHVRRTLAAPRPSR